MNLDSNIGRTMLWVLLRMVPVTEAVSITCVEENILLVSGVRRTETDQLSRVGECSKAAGPSREALPVQLNPSILVEDSCVYNDSPHFALTV